MILAGDLRKGSKLLFREEPYIVLDYQQVKPGKGGAYMRTKMKNLISGLTHEETFRTEEKLAIPDLQFKDMLYLYNQNGLYEFMDQENYDQLSFSKDQIEEVLNYLKEQTVYQVLNFNDKPIGVTAPLHMELQVKETVPGVKGDTAQGGSKPATLETGLTLNVPLFVNEGDIIKVDTRDGKYIERVKK